jgi:hypothetical protein
VFHKFTNQGKNMLYPILSLKRLDDRDEERHAEVLMIPPTEIGFVAPLAGGGSRVYSSAIPNDEATGGADDGEYYIDVTASPSMIAQMITNAIASVAKCQTLGALEAQMQTAEKMQRSQSGIAIARGGIPPINGG